MQTIPTLSTLTTEKAHARRLDQFFDYMAAQALHTKATVTGMTAGNDPSLSEPGQLMAFAAVVAEMAAFGRVRPLTIQVVPYIRIPTPLSDPTATWEGEGQPIPVARANWTHATAGVSKLGTIFVMSEDLLKTSDPRIRSLVTRLAARQLARALDTVFLGTAAASADSPAGVLAGAPQLGGGSPADLGRDLSTLFAYVTDGRPTTPVLFISPRVCLYLATLNEDLFRTVGVNGGAIAGIPVIPTVAAGNRIILLDADQLATYDGGVEVQGSRQATVQMLDNPTNNSATATATTMVSMFETNSAAVKLLQFCDWRLLAEDAIAYTELTDLGGSPA